MPDTRNPKFFYGYVIVAAAFVLLTVMGGTYYSFGVFFTPLLTEFGWTRAMTSGAFSLSILLEGVIGIPMGRATDRWDPRMVITLSGLLLGLGYLLMPQISALWHFYLLYGVIIGIGLGGLWVPPVSIVVRWFAKRRNMMTGIAIAGTGVGGLITPPLASWLISTYGWRLSYVILGGAVLVLVVLAAQFLKRDPAQMGQLPYGKNRSELHESQLGNDGLSFREAVSTKQLWLVSGIFLCFGFVAFTIMVHIVPHAIELGIPPASAANILAIIGGVGIAGKTIMGAATDKIGTRAGIIIGFILLIAPVAWLIVATELWMLYLFAAFFAFGYGTMVALMSPAIAEFFGLSSVGVLLGIVNLAATIGCATGPVVAGWLFDINGNYQLVFQLSAAIAVIGLILTLFIRPIDRQKGIHNQPSLFSIK